jgi:TRAP-type C4-dicarboxylate transport system permease small subunit
VNGAQARPPTFVDRLAARAEALLGRVLVALMSLMVLDVSWQVASRFIFHAPSSFTEELAGFLLIWIGLLGAAYGFRTRAHLGIDLLPARLEGMWRRRIDASAHLLVLLFGLATMVGGGVWLVRLAFRLHQTSAAVGWQMGYVYLALPVSGALVVLFSLQSLVVAAAPPGTGKDLGTEGVDSRALVEPRGGI